MFFVSSEVFETSKALESVLIPWKKESKKRVNCRLSRFLSPEDEEGNLVHIINRVIENI